MPLEEEKDMETTSSAMAADSLGISRGIVPTEKGEKAKEVWGCRQTRTVAKEASQPHMKGKEAEEKEDMEDGLHQKGKAREKEEKDPNLDPAGHAVEHTSLESAHRKVQGKEKGLGALRSGKEK